MTATAQTYEAALERVCAETVAQHASTIDQNGTFPAESIQALAKTGLLGAFSSPDSGGMGLGLTGAARVVRRVAEECGSTAMVVTMHYSGVAVLEAHASSDVRAAAASGAHLSTLAFSESGSRSHFWAPVSTAKEADGAIELNAARVGLPRPPTRLHMCGRPAHSMRRAPARFGWFRPHPPVSPWPAHSRASDCAVTILHRWQPPMSAYLAPRCWEQMEKASAS